MKLQFVRFDCGCIGTLPRPDKKCFMISYCDRDNESEEIEPWVLDKNEVRVDDLLSKDWEPLDEFQVYEILEKITKLVYDGYRYRKIKRLILN